MVAKSQKYKIKLIEPRKLRLKGLLYVYKKSLSLPGIVSQKFQFTKNSIEVTKIPFKCPKVQIQYKFIHINTKYEPVFNQVFNEKTGRLKKFLLDDA